MAVFVALYRGINVGGKRSVKMAALRALHERLGHSAVRNYVQSGNIVFSGKGAAATIARRVAAAFAEEFGFAAQVFVLSGEQWSGIVAGNPFARVAATSPKQVHAGICAGEPDAAALAALLAKTGGPEEFAIRGNVIYVHAPDGLGRSKFAAGMERAAAVPVTVRNWQTVVALEELASSGR